jgi:hypothetical protein
LGVFSASNIPGGRYGAATWTDRQGSLWLFGGYGYDDTGLRGGVLNDMWEFRPSTHRQDAPDEYRGQCPPFSPPKGKQDHRESRSRNPRRAAAVAGCREGLRGHRECCSAAAGVEEQIRFATLQPLRRSPLRLS